MLARKLLLKHSYLEIRLSSFLSGQKFKMSTSDIPLDFKALPEHRSLVIEKFGEPKDSVILKLRRPEEVLPKVLGPKQVLIRHLAATINPADINMIQGIYGIRPKLPSVVGNEGVARVEQVGSQVKNLQPGDLALGVLVTENWQSYSVQSDQSLYKINNKLEITTAAQLKVNPCTAYRMIKDFYNLKQGDTIIQNGANSAVGVYAIQLAKLWGFKTINVIRDRPNKDEIVQELKQYGADIVLTEEEIGNVEVVSPIVEQIGKPKLFLNCVGGKNAVNCQRILDHGGYSVTYGAMSRQPFSLAATSLIFKDHKFHGFWVSRWYKDRELDRRHEIESMLNEVGELFVKGTLKPKSSKLISFEDRNIAFEGSNNTKCIFSINN